MDIDGLEDLNVQCVLPLEKMLDEFSGSAKDSRGLFIFLKVLIQLMIIFINSSVAQLKTYLNKMVQK